MNLFELFVKIGVKDEASDKISTLSGKLGSGLKNAAKIGVAAVGAVATGIGALAKSATDAYADYEQLVGGVETLFQTSSGKVQWYANRAYKTAGMSANQYMETVTSFSASLLQSLGGDTRKAADYADRAIIDMADNANKMGTSIEMIENAYQGFAKQNYTMLDNLKLGYGGTKTEMERLIADANRVKVANGEMADLSIESFADVTEAIHIIQTEMGITGTTAEESSDTISGSVASMKSAWENLKRGIADENADIDGLLDDFMDSVGVAAGNIWPRFKTALDRLGQLFEEKGPEMIAEGAIMLGKFAVGLIEGIPDMIKKIPDIVNAIKQAFIDRADIFKDIGKRIVNGIKNGFETAWNTFAKSFPNLINALANSSNYMATGNVEYLVNGSHAGGLRSVPFDGYIAELHQGERVLTREEADDYNRGEKSQINIYQTIQSKPMTAADAMQQARYQAEQAVFLSV